MTETHKNEESYTEMDLGEILRALYGRKWLILCTTALVGLVTAGVTSSLPNVYESSAALIVREPELPIAGDYPPVIVETLENLPRSRIQQPITPLSIETLVVLAESTKIKRALFEKLLEDEVFKEREDKPPTFGRFQGVLSTEEIKAPIPNGAFPDLDPHLPVIVLKARAPNPNEAKAIANAWALIVEAEGRKIYTNDVEALDVFISDIYGKSNATLAKYEAALAEKTMEAGLDLKRVRIKAINDKSAELEAQNFDLNAELLVDGIAISEGARRIAEQQYEGEWIGTVAETASIRGEAFPFDKEKLSPQAQKVVELVLQKVRQAESLREYRKQHYLLGKQEEFEHYRRDLSRILTEKAVVEDELPSAQAELAALSDRIKTIPEKITLDKAITDDALWNARVTKTLSKDAGLVPLKSEVVNTVYVSTLNTIVDLTAKVERLKGSSEQLAKSAETAIRRIADLESEIDIVQRETDLRQNELIATEESLALFREDYLSEMNLVGKLRVENARRGDELKIREELRKTIAQEMSGLERDVIKNQLEIDALAREVDKSKNVGNALASNAEEIALLRVSAESASHTGTVILYRAEANPLTVGPERGKILLASMLTAFVLCSVLVCSAKLLRTKGS